MTNQQGAPYAKETAMASRRSRTRRDKRQPIHDFDDTEVKK